MNRYIVLILSIIFTTPAWAIDGKQEFEKSCKMCHQGGMPGTPQLGDKAAWKPRLAKGEKALINNAIKGISSSTGFMPPRGGNASLSDAQIAAAVKYMMSRSQ